eukprot:scaffold231459_cov31-Attheya_sp.AAC.1
MDGSGVTPSRGWGRDGWGGHHAKVDGACLELVVVELEDNAVSRSSRGKVGCDVGWFLEDVLGAGHDRCVHGDILEGMEQAVSDA